MSVMFSIGKRKKKRENRHTFALFSFLTINLNLTSRLFAGNRNSCRVCFGIGGKGPNSGNGSGN